MEPRAFSVLLRLSRTVECSELGSPAHEPVDPEAMIRMFLHCGFLRPKMIKKTREHFFDFLVHETH